MSPENLPPSSPPPMYPPPSPAYPAAGYSAIMTSNPVVPVPFTSRWAIASLVCSILGLCTGIGAILGVVFGHIALSQINKSNMIVQGRGLAIAGLILGYLQIAAYVLIGIISVATSGAH